MGNITGERDAIYSAKALLVRLQLGVAKALAAHWVLFLESDCGW